MKAKNFNSGNRHKDAIPPVKEGWYWFKGHVIDKFVVEKPEIVQVVKNVDGESEAGILAAYFSRDLNAYNLADLVGVWTGPFWEPEM